MAALKYLVILLAVPAVSYAALLVLCESEQKVLNCPKGIIRVNEAMYGRTSKDICNTYSNIHNTNCRASGTVGTVRDKCEGKRACELYAVNGWFGEPCDGTYKYLAVDYECVEL